MADFAMLGMRVQREMKVAFGTLGVILFAGFLFIIIRWCRMKKGVKVSLCGLGVILLAVLLYVASFSRDRPGPMQDHLLILRFGTERIQLPNSSTPRPTGPFPPSSVSPRRSA